MNSYTLLHNSSDQEYSEFLKEYLLQSSAQSNDPEINYEGLYLKACMKKKKYNLLLKFIIDGEMEAEWLTSIGYPELSKPFEQVKS